MIVNETAMNIDKMSSQNVVLARLESLSCCITRTMCGLMWGNVNGSRKYSQYWRFHVTEKVDLKIRLEEGRNFIYLLI